jgi:RHS repeat-associated protein
MTRQTVAGVMDMEYRFSATQNNGRLTQSKDWVTGEEVTYQYDSLQRLISAVTTGPEWGQSYTYDGFGNMTAQTVTKGSAPTMSLLVSGTTNRITTGGFGYDANGNLTASPGMTMTYDVDNRLASVAGEAYRYGPDNRRVWKQNTDATEEVYFYGIIGQKISANQVQVAGGAVYIWTLHTYEYFAGRLIRVDTQAVMRDRLGSVRAKGASRMSYFPYGQERTATGNNQEKFGTYYRDGSGFDYADQRYYASTWGRFMTADPTRSALNLYGYVEGDPVNSADPSGLTAGCVVTTMVGGGPPVLVCPPRPGADAGTTYF